MSTAHDRVSLNATYNKPDASQLSPAVEDETQRTGKETSPQSTNTYLNKTQRSTYKVSSSVIKPDVSIVRKAYLADLSLIDSMHFDEGGSTWESIANDFVLEPSNKRIKWFVETMH